MSDGLDDEEVARLFHDTYKRLAPEFGYITRKDTKEFDPNSNNGKLMIEVCRIVIQSVLYHLDGIIDE
jgi:hypothetical protein